MVAQTIFHYRVLKKLGAGGMGEVYLAQDTKLDRKVALKILPADVASDQKRMQRFVQEAKAASALNHPNLLTIYEIGETDSTHFIATEYIDGETLRERTRKAPQKLGDVLDVAIQTASALSAAHASGIIHRDIKPENIMLRRDGIVKVLDFGLAKLTERMPPDSVDTEAPTRAVFNTEPGVVMGTAVYMSPEQARGMPVDARTDIFSLGVVLYEMVAGCLPFAGSTSSEVMASILSENEPQPLARYSREVPIELERIVSKALRKNRDERYQTIKDLLLDLKSLKQELEFRRKLERSVPPGLKSATEAITEPGTVETITAPTAQSPSRIEPLTSGLMLRRKGVFLAVVAVLILAVTAAVYFYFAGHQKTAINSIAVLPFVNASADPETEYLSDGITESLINSLSQLPNLKMIARSSVFRYKGKEVNPQAVGRELGVQAILTGRVVQHGDNLSISAELVDVQNNSHLWGEQYNRKLADLLTIQSEISLEISQKLRLRLAGEDQKRVTKHYTENTEAYQLYLKGRFYWNKRTREAYKKAIEFFNQAIEKDSNYALAYAGLADCYSQGDYPLPPKEKYPLARQAALKALELDDTLAEPHAALGRVKQEYDWDREGAEKEFKRAIELNPNSSLAHMRYGGFFIVIGKHDEAIAEGKQAVALDPLSALINWSLAYDYYWARRYDEAIEQDRKTLEIDPGYVRSIYQIGLSYEKKGMYEKAFEQYLKWAALVGRTAEVIAWKAAYTASDVRGYHLKQLDQAIAKTGQDPNSLYDVAVLHARLGEKEPALEWLQKAVDEHANSLVYMKVEPAFDNMRSDPKFVEVMKRIGLVP